MEGIVRKSLQKFVNLSPLGLQEKTKNKTKQNKRNDGEQEGCILSSGLSTSSLSIQTGVQHFVRLREKQKIVAKGYLLLLPLSISPRFLRLLSASYYKHQSPSGRKQSKSKQQGRLLRMKADNRSYNIIGMIAVNNCDISDTVAFVGICLQISDSISITLISKH